MEQSHFPYGSHAPTNLLPAGPQFRVAIKNDYQISLPPQLATIVGDIQLSNFEFDFDLEKKILAEAGNENPNWSQLVLENIPSVQPESVIREEHTPLHSSMKQRLKLENSLAGPNSVSFKSKDEESVSREKSKFLTALYSFVADGENELNLTAGEEVELQYEVDGWYFVRKKRPGKDGKMEGLVPVLYVS